MQKDNFLKSLRVNIGFTIEVLKSFLIMLIVFFAIIIVLFSVIHNLLKIREIYAEDTAGYKNLVDVNSNRMNVYIEGEGDKTAILLSNFGEPSPVVKYKAYKDRLVDNNYRVVIIEYFGYGYSLSTKDTRDIENITNEINEALNKSGIEGPYMMIANGISGIYAENYIDKFPDLVDKLVLIDSVYANSIDEKYIKDTIQDNSFNITLTSFIENTGYARILSYIKPNIFGIDKMKELGFSSSDISLYRKMIANRFYTKTMKNEYKNLIDNMEQSKDYVFPEYLNVIQILSNEYIKEFSEYKKEKLIKKDIKQYANDLITNYEIQKIINIKGEKNNLNLSNPDEVINTIITN